MIALLNLFAEDEIPESVNLKRRKGKLEAVDGGESKPAEEEEEEEEEEEREEKGGILAVTGLEGESPELSASGDEEEDSDTSSTDIEGELFYNDRHSEQVRMMSWATRA